MEEIIIDGVDVRGCKNFSCGICEEENKIPRTINHFTADCRMYPNCNYKQLKRKEQECEELKKQRQADKGLITSTGKMNYQLMQKYGKLENCIIQIKEIAEKCRNSLYGYDQEKYPKQILQKISKFEVKMKTKQEIEDKLKQHNKIRNFINPSTEDGKAFIFQDGFISALKWVLEIDEAENE